jgi:hypothetical protein
MPFMKNIFQPFQHKEDQGQGEQYLNVPWFDMKVPDHRIFRKLADSLIRIHALFNQLHPLLVFGSDVVADQAANRENDDQKKYKRSHGYEFCVSV